MEGVFPVPHDSVCAEEVRGGFSDDKRFGVTCCGTSNVLDVLSIEDCEVCELGRLTTVGLFLFAAVEATNPFFLPAVTGEGFLSALELPEFGEGPSTIICEFGLADEVAPVSPSESGGEIKRAVGRGPVADGPLVFLSIGGGITVWPREAAEDDVVLARLWLTLCKAVVLDTAGPGRRFFLF